MDLAPIAVFAFRRPDKLKALLDSLSNCEEAKESDLHIFVDGPRSDDELRVVQETLGVARGEGRFASVSISASEVNLGLARSITDGVSQMFESHERLIVLEDDLLVSPHFLKFMNEALTVYELDEEVVSVHAYLYPTEQVLPQTFFLRGADCWGWGTWRRGWAIYNPDSKQLLSELARSRQTREFDFNGSYAFAQMLRDQSAGKNDSWAVRWYASAFLADKLTLYPNTCLAINTGIDGSGTHGKGDESYLNDLSERPVEVIWQTPVENAVARKAFEGFFHRNRVNPLILLRTKLRKFVFLLSGKNY